VAKNYTYDIGGNRNSLTVTGGVGYTVNYHYDLNNRLYLQQSWTPQNGARIHDEANAIRGNLSRMFVTRVCKQSVNRT
jgi:hypothetical protein